jgi:hypothetical protein
LVKSLSFYLQNNIEEEEAEDKAVEYFIGNIAFDKMMAFRFYKKHNNFTSVL